MADARPTFSFQFGASANCQASCRSSKGAPRSIDRHDSARRPLPLVGLRASGVCVDFLAGGIDHVVKFDESGIWKRSYQQGLVYTLVAGEVAGALWEGGETRIGKTFWQAIDSSAIGAVSSQALKYIFTARVPTNTRSESLVPGQEPLSFPSGEVTAVSAIVTPFVLEYVLDNPAVYALECCRCYDMVARVEIASSLANRCAGWICPRHADRLLRAFARPSTDPRRAA